MVSQHTPRYASIQYVNLSIYSSNLSSSNGSCFVPAIPQMQEEWHTNATLVLAGITTYSCCFSIGPPIFAPLSETIGRRPIYVFCCLTFTATIIPTSFAQVVPPFLSLTRERDHVPRLTHDFRFSRCRRFRNRRRILSGSLDSCREGSSDVIFCGDNLGGTVYRPCPWKFNRGSS